MSYAGDLSAVEFDAILDQAAGPAVIVHGGAGTPPDWDPAPYLAAKAVWDKEDAPLAEALAKFEREQLPSRLADWEKTQAAEYRAHRPEGHCRSPPTCGEKSRIRAGVATSAIPSTMLTRARLAA